jgi:competence protein ComGC
MNGNPPPLSATQPKTSGMAITSMILGILGVVLAIMCVGVLFAIPAVILGHIAASKINRSGGALIGKGFAIAGFVTGYCTLGLMLLLIPIAIPNFIKARSTAQKNSCINNLRMIEIAKQQWATENSKREDAVPTKADLLPLMHGDTGRRECPAGGVYSIGRVNEQATCTVEGHVLPVLN